MEHYYQRQIVKRSHRRLSHKGVLLMMFPVTKNKTTFSDKELIKKRVLFLFDDHKVFSVRKLKLINELF